jgi:hypothetical protein
MYRIRVSGEFTLTRTEILTIESYRGTTGAKVAYTPCYEISCCQKRLKLSSSGQDGNDVDFLIYLD